MPAAADPAAVGRHGDGGGTAGEVATGGGVLEVLFLARALAVLFFCHLLVFCHLLSGAILSYHIHMGIRSVRMYLRTYMVCLWSVNVGK